MSETQVTAFRQHLAESAVRYFPELAGESVEVLPTAVDRRPASTLYHFLIRTRAVQYPVLVKVRHPPQVYTDPKRPALAVADPDQQYEREYRALAAIQNYFDAANDPRFGTIRMLDALPDQRAIIMIKSENPDLRRAFARRNRLLLPFQSDKLYTVFNNAGAWLRLYHSLPDEEHVVVRHSTRADYEHAVEKMIKFLMDHIGTPVFFDRVRAAIALRAGVMPDELPLGRGHGDFSLRNILVDSNNKVTVIDTLARWKTPIYEDIGYFLIRLHINQLQLYSQGLAFSPRWIARCEQEFLNGYFQADPVPQTIIDLFKVQALLDQWTFLVEWATGQQAGKARIKRSLRLLFTNRQFTKITGNLLGITGTSAPTRDDT